MLDRQNQIKDLESSGEKNARELREAKLELDKMRGRLDSSTQGSASEIEALSKQVCARVR